MRPGRPGPTRSTSLLGPVLLIAAIGLPLLWSGWAAVMAGADPAAWRILLTGHSTGMALALSIWTGVAATALTVGISASILARNFPGPGWPRVVRVLGPMLATPHTAFAIGMVFLLAPSGWILRLFSPWATGFAAPPPWSTTQDPWGLGLVAVLVAKEVPFLLWVAASQLQRSDEAQRLARDLQVARSMGYAASSAWWRVVWPQLWPRLRWPMLAMLAYSMTVVDLALVIGPGSPPTLAVLAWGWLLDADLATNTQGAAAAWLLVLALAIVARLFWWVASWSAWSRRRTSGRRGALRTTGRVSKASRGIGLLAGLYLVVMLALAVGSVSGVWAFPALLPQTFSFGAWRSVAASASTIATTLTLGLASGASALVWSVAWLETAPQRWDMALRRVAYLPLVLPSVLWVIGVHATTLRLGIDARWAGLWLAHTLACVPYVLISLSPAYSGFDPRYRFISATLGRGRAAFLWKVKWPLLRASLASALAVGFAVSVAQYLPTLFIGAGRFATVTTEAVTLASGAQRSLTSAYAWLQWLLPVLGFSLAAWAGMPRRFRARALK
jgi:putative thiamine transport system permease protein